MHTLNVELGERSYPIYIGPGLLTQADLLQQHIPGKKVLVVSNETILPLYRDAIEQALAGRDFQTLALPDGEKYKTLDSLNQIFTFLLENRYDRNSTLIALGGGVIGDISGFAAASYQRGIHFIQIPTTLLSQVDSSVGGKTAVNHALGKNMIGAFYQPRCVLADTQTLNTLPDNELSAGLAEVIKYGLIRDPDFFAWLEQNLTVLMQRDTDALIHAIAVSCQTKADIVADDEHEKGQRALLNLGHTFGHAIETFVAYQGWLHGEAVGTGMLMAAHMSQLLGWLNADDVARAKQLIEQAKLPTAVPNNMTSDDFIALMARDKKVLDGTLRLVLLQSIGNAVVSSDFDNSALSETLALFTNPRANS